jgi:hypothetical protein
MTPGTVWGVDVYAGIEKLRTLRFLFILIDKIRRRGGKYSNIVK